MSACKCKGGGTACPECGPNPAAAGSRLTVEHRFATEAEPAPQTGYGRLGDRNWSVQAYTGAPVSTVPGGRWNRGDIFRPPTVSMQHEATYPGPMYDPTDPRTWPPRWGDPSAWLPNP